MQTQSPLTLTQLLERFRGFSWIAPNTNFINLRPAQLNQAIATMEASELELADKTEAIEFALRNHCQGKGVDELCPVCTALRKAYLFWKR